MIKVLAQKRVFFLCVIRFNWQLIMLKSFLNKEH